MNHLFSNGQRAELPASVENAKTSTAALVLLVGRTHGARWKVFRHVEFKVLGAHVLPAGNRIRNVPPLPLSRFVPMSSCRAICLSFGTMIWHDRSSGKGSRGGRRGNIHEEGTWTPVFAKKPERRCVDSFCFLRRGGEGQSYGKSCQNQVIAIEAEIRTCISGELFIISASGIATIRCCVA